MKLVSIVKKFMRSELPRIIVGASLFALAILFDVLVIPIFPTILYISALVVSGLPVFIGAIYLIVYLMNLLRN